MHDTFEFTLHVTTRTQLYTTITITRTLSFFFAHKYQDYTNTLFCLLKNVKNQNTSRYKTWHGSLNSRCTHTVWLSFTHMRKHDELSVNWLAVTFWFSTKNWNNCNMKHIKIMNCLNWCCINDSPNFDNGYILFCHEINLKINILNSFMWLTKIIRA